MTTPPNQQNQGGPPNTVPLVGKPVIIETDGIFGELQDGTIINAGGVSGSTFTVGGQALLFANGQPTSGGNGGITLQTAYNNSPTVGGQAGITLSGGKDFVLNDPNNNNYLVVSSEDGSVTINGDLTVNGTSTVINTVVIQSDHQLIQPATGTTTALSIQPALGVTPIVDLVSIRRTFNTPPVLRVDSNGNLILTQNMTISGTINGVNIVTLNTQVQDHLTATVAGPIDQYQHEASAILITPISDIPNATNVQQALQALDVKINNIAPPALGNVFGYEYDQPTPVDSWTINHNGNTLRATVTIYDTNQMQVLPEMVEVIDVNNVLVTFTTPQAGKAFVILF